MKHIITVFCLFLLTLILPSTSHAYVKASGSSAQLIKLPIASAPDTRAEALEAYLEKYNSPLAYLAPIYVYVADKYNLPWTLLPAIAGTESTFGKAVPCTNAYGWGIYGTNMFCFNSEEEAIYVISKALREKYIDTWGATDIYTMGKYYASSPHWPVSVTYFMKDIERFKVAYDAKNLTITL